MIMADVAKSCSGICLQHSKSEAAGGGSGEEDWIPELGLRDRAGTKHADQQYRAWVDCTSVDFEIALRLIQACTHSNHCKFLLVPLLAIVRRSLHQRLFCIFHRNSLLQ